MPAIVEDGSSAISYAGSWSVLTGSSSEYSGGAVHSSSSSGSTATIRFSGTSITVFGTNPSVQTSGAHLYASFILDGVENSWDRTVHGTAYYKDRFWDSGHLSDGTHTLVVRNTGSNPAFMLDYFEIEGSAITPINPRPPTTTTTERNLDSAPSVSTSVLTQRTTLTVSGSGSTATETLTDSDGLTVTNSLLSTTTQTSSTTSRSNSTSGVVSQSLSVNPETGQTVTAFQVVTTSISGSAGHMTLYPDGNGGFDASGAAREGGIPIGAIVGAVVGSLLFLVFVILFVILFLRQRRRAAALAEALENARAVPMESGNGPPPSISHRISESLRPAITSKFRGQQRGDSRPFQRLDEESSSSQSGGSGYPQAGGSAPMLSLNLYPNEKGTSSFMGTFGAETSESHTSYPSPIVSNASAFQGTAHDLDEAPPAYSNRNSSVPFAR